MTPRQEEIRVIALQARMLKEKYKLTWGMVRGRIRKLTGVSFIGSPFDSAVSLSRPSANDEVRAAFKQWIEWQKVQPLPAKYSITAPGELKDTPADKWWSALTTSTRNTLQRYGCMSPWDSTIKELIRIPGIGPKAIAEIAAVTDKHCI